MKLNNKNVLITGGAGFVPSHVVDAFIAAGANVTALDNFSTGKRSNLSHLKNDIQIINLDIRDKRIHNLIEKQDVVIHMAANADVPTSVKKPDYDFQNNVIGSYNVLKACLSSNVQKVVFASSAAVYGEPQYTPIDEKHPTSPRSPYGASKLSIECLGIAYYETFKLPFTSIRIFNTYGIRQPRYVMYDLLRKLYENPTKLEVLGTGEQIRDYSYATDTANCFLLAVQHDNAVGEIYNVAGGTPISIKDLVERLIFILGLRKVDIVFTGKSWPGDINILSANISKAKNELGFQPKISIDDGIKLLNAWLSKQNV
jgi:UDP-glucose 4-epimerase